MEINNQLTQKLRKIFLSAIIITAFLAQSQQLHAQKYAAEFLSVGVGAKALSMGGAFVALANDGTAVYWNPAGLSRLRQKELFLMHASRFSGIVHTNFIGLSLPTHTGLTFAISYFRIGIDDIPKSTRLDEFERPIIEGYMQDIEQAIFLSFSKKVTPNFSIGGNLKTIFQTIDDYSAMGFGIDLGGIYQITDRLSFGANFQDITGTHVFWDTGHRDTRYPTINWGFALTQKVNFLYGALTIAGSQNIRLEGQNSENAISFGDIAGSDFQAGFEYSFMNTVAFRAGMERKNFTAGTGIQFKFLAVDYAFVSYDLGNTHRISGSIKF